jgi:arabinofuranosyltransferase
MTLKSFLLSRRATFLTQLPWLVVATLYVVIVYRTAWVGDDIFITLRTIDNFVHGYGLRWNVLDRVQTYTHPLWMLVLLAVYAVTREPFYTTIAVGMVTSLATFIVVRRVARRNDTWAPLFALVLALSRCYVDYSTSGLENPLTHLLTALFFLWVVSEQSELSAPQKLLRGSLLAGLCVLNREDSALLFAPALVWLALRGNVPLKKTLSAFGLGALAPLAFTAFSLVYYGFPFPNTAYAKLNVELPRLELIGRGLKYVLELGYYDPVSALCIVLAIVLITVRGRAIERALLAGVLFYLIYVVSIGGDFMSGRFFSTPLLLSVLLLIERAPRFGWGLQVAFGLTLASLMFAPRYPLWKTVEHFPSQDDVWNGVGIVDERIYYFRGASLAYDEPDRPLRPWHHRALDGYNRRHERDLVLARGAVGYYAYFAGPGVHFIDIWALCDPLLARIPFRTTGKWRMGHFERKRPKGYERAVRGDASLIEQPFLAQVYRDLLTVTRGPLFSTERFRAIYRLNTGYYHNGLKYLEY